MIGQRNQAARGENIDTGAGPGRFRPAFRRADQPLAKRIGADRRWKGARNHTDGAIEIEFAENHITCQHFCRYRAQSGHEAKRNGKIEMRSFLGQIGRREIDDDLFCRQRQTRGMQGGLHPLPAFSHRLVRQADNLDADLSGRDHDLHLDGHTLHALKCNRIDPCHHGLPPQTGRAGQSFMPYHGHPQATCHRAKNKTRTSSEQFLADDVF